MPRRKLPYRPGDAFAVPLGGGEYVLGVIARMDGRGVILGYFFGPRMCTLPARDEIPHHRLEDAVLVQMFGDPGILSGTWPILGQVPGWAAESWPMPCFGRRDIVSGQPLRVRCDENTLMEVSVERTSSEEVEKLPDASLAGAQFIEARLSHIIPRIESQ